MLGGRNGVGKTTVLEAVRVYAARGRPGVLHELLDRREEFSPAIDEDDKVAVSPDYATLFYGRTATREQPISIGPNSGDDDLRIEVSTPQDWSPHQAELFSELSEGADLQVLKVLYRSEKRLLPWMPVSNELRTNWSSRRLFRDLRSGRLEDKEWPIIKCESLGPGLPNNNQLAHYWDSVALTEEEDLSLQALRLTRDGIERVAVVGDEEPRYRRLGRRVVVKLRDHPRPVPLKSLGDGVTRLFATGLALANSRDGFLLLDEAENGIHYSVQREFWRMVLRAAQQHNVQVLATTHSNDCVKGFARAANEIQEAEGVYLRLDRYSDRVRAMEYPEEDLDTVEKQNIEVR